MGEHSSRLFVFSDLPFKPLKNKAKDLFGFRGPMECDSVWFSIALFVDPRIIRRFELESPIGG